MTRKGEVHMTDNHMSVISLKEELKIEREEQIRLEYRKDRLTKKLKFYRPIEVEERKIIISKLKIIQKHISEQSKVVFLLEKSMDIINESIDRLQGIEKKVFYLHRFSGKSLLEISEELGYDYGYIRKISSRAHKKIQ